MGAAEQPISLRKYAEHRRSTGLTGGSITAVTKAITAGRLSRAVVMIGGRPKIRTVHEADAEWAANTRSEFASGSPSRDAAPPQAADGAKTNEPSPRAAEPADYQEARYWREIELWRQAEVKAAMDALELAARRGEVVPVAEARAAVIEAYTLVKTKLLGVPTRARQRCPHLTVEDVHLLDELIREALEELADGGE